MNKLGDFIKDMTEKSPQILPVLEQIFSIEAEKKPKKRHHHLEFIEKVKLCLWQDGMPTKAPKDWSAGLKYIHYRNKAKYKKEVLLIDIAYELAKSGHRLQQRDDGSRYFDHCRSTALILIDELGIRDWEMIVTALLHDMLEDSYLLSNSSITHIFGKRVAYLVRCLTKPKKDDHRFTTDAERHQWYFRRLRRAKPDVKLIKLCDRLHNMREINNCSPDKRKRKLEETIKVYLPLIKSIKEKYPMEADILKRELDKAIDKAYSLNDFLLS